MTATPPPSASTDAARSSRLGAQLADAARPQVQFRGEIDRIGQAEADVVGLRVGPGELVRIGEAESVDGPASVLAEVVAVEGRRATVLPYGDFRGHRVGDPVEWIGGQLEVPVGAELLGRVLDGLGQPLDDGPSLHRAERQPVHNQAPGALSRPPVVEPMPVGIRVVDTLLTCGRGQRIAIMAGSGVGKSSLLSMLVRGSNADVNVLCLVGERGREVRQFLDEDLGPDGMARSVIVVATSDQPALIRRNAAYAATRIAEWFRDQGQHVNLLMDSVTRFAIAQREIGLSAGEIPTSRGFPPSALGLLPGLLERAGTAATGSITGFYTVLVEGDDVNDPIGDTVRSIVDGHVVLSRELANAGHFPSIDVLASASRVALAVTDPAQQHLAAEVRRLLAIHERARDLIEVGAYAPGNDPELDRAVALAPTLEQFRRQGLHEVSPPDQSWALLDGLINGVGWPDLGGSTQAPTDVRPPAGAAEAAPAPGPAPGFGSLAGDGPMPGGAPDGEAGGAPVGVPGGLSTMGTMGLGGSQLGLQTMGENR